MRLSGRAANQMRPIKFERPFTKHAEGSCLACFGDTHVLCTASVETRLPSWIKGQGKGWITAEYGMLPRATNERMRREAANGKQSGRTHEIQRLIGRSLRTVVDLVALGEYQITLDCDVLQADGGTRTAAISGSWLALYDCLKWMEARTMFAKFPLKDHVAAVSCGLWQNIAVLDLDYGEDSTAQTDANFIMTGEGNFVEIQATAEGANFTQTQFSELLILARHGISQLIDLQKQLIAVERSPERGVVAS